MLTHNKSIKRCLILSRNQQTLESVNSVLCASGYHVDNIFERKAAMKCFFQYHHDLFFIDDMFLPRFPHRLLQFFKMAHKTPGVIILSENRGIQPYFKHFEKDIPLRVSSFADRNDIKQAIEAVISVLSESTKNYFKRDIFIQFSIAIPLLIITIYLTFKYFIK